MILDRRGILKFIAGGAIGSLFTPIPWKLADDLSIWSQNWPWIPRIPKGALKQKPSLVKLGGTEYGLMINLVDKQPITVSGNPKHCLSQGGLDPLAAASVQLLYTPARIKQPMLKEGSGKFKPITWSKAESLLQNKINSAGKGRLACISGDETSSTNELLSAFLTQLNSNSFYFLPSDCSTLHQVWSKAVKGTGEIGFDLENSDYILCLGADILDTWGCYVKNQKLFASDRLDFDYVGPKQTSTAASAGTWLPVNPTAYGDLAFFICSHLFKMGHELPYSILGTEQLKDFALKNYPLSKSKSKIGVDPEQIKTLTKKLKKARSPLVLAGTSSGSGGSPFDFFAVLALNLLLGRLNEKGGLRCIPAPPKVLSSSIARGDVRQKDLIADLIDQEKGKRKLPELIFFYESNPYYSLPNPEKFKGILNKIPFKVSFSQFMDETAANSDLILPTPLFLERMDDSFTPFGSSQAIYSVAEPVCSPVTDSRPVPDLLLSLGKQLGLKLGVSHYAGLIRQKSELLNSNLKSLRQGNPWMDRTTEFQGTLQLWNEQIKKICKTKALDQPKDLPLYLLPEQDLRFGTPQTGIAPFALKTITKKELDDKTLVVSLNQQTADKFKLEQDAKVKLSSENQSLSAKVNIEESIITDAVEVPMGFGHSNWDKFSQEKGKNLNNLFTVFTENGYSQWCGSKVKIKKI